MSQTCDVAQHPRHRVTRVFIVVGIRLYREGLVDVLGRAQGLTVIGALAGGSEALTQVAATQPHVALLDVATPQSYALARDFHRSVPEMSVVALGLKAEPELLTYAEAGIMGYVTEDASLDELIGVIRSAARGELICSPRLAGGLVRRLAALAAAHTHDSLKVRLTTREHQILALLEQNLTNKDIANHLGIEVATIKNHVHNLLHKLGVHRRHEAVWAMKRALGSVTMLPTPGRDRAVH